MPKRAVLLVNLGSPDSPAVADVRRYLREFLGDARVIDRPRNRFLRSLLVNQVIIRRRVESSARAYASIWTKDGSPLVVTSRSVREKLEAALGGGCDGRAKPPAEPRMTMYANSSNDSSNGSPGGFALPSQSAIRNPQSAISVYLAMRYGNPSIAAALGRMARDGVERVLLFPQYPHFAKSTWETVTAAVREEAARLGMTGRARSPSAPQPTRDSHGSGGLGETALPSQMRIDCVEPFYGDADYIDALAESAGPWLARAHDHVLVSFHGLPERHVREADATGAHCLRAADCCEGGAPAHATCYRAQCLRTARLFAQRAGIAPGRWSVAFQSRLAGEPWLRPFTDEMLAQLPARGVRRLLVISPAFVTDCLETLEELCVEGKKTFLAAGGEFFQQIPCLNDQRVYVDFLAARARAWLERAWLGGG